MTDVLRACISFAKWSKLHKTEPHDLAELLTLARKAFKAGERECNTGKLAHKQRVAFEEKAKELGFVAYWPGLWPELKKNGREVYLPEVCR